MRLGFVAVCLLCLPTAAVADCRADLAEIFRNSAAAGPFRIERDEFQLFKRARQVEIKVVPPGDAEEVSVNPTQTTGMRIVGGNVWLRDETGWWPYGLGNNREFYDYIVKITPAAMEETMPKKVECLGTVRFEDVAYLGFRFFKADDPLGMLATVYVEPKARLIARMEQTWWGIVKVAGLRISYDPALTLSPAPSGPLRE